MFSEKKEEIIERLIKEKLTLKHVSKNVIITE